MTRPRNIPRLLAIAAAVGVPVPVGGYALYDQLRPTQTDTARLVRAVDGDTVIARVGGKTERVRLVGLNTPESVKRGSPVECWGPQASKNAKAWAKRHRTIKLVRDRATPDRDRYGRLLRYVEPTGEGRDLTTVQLLGGHGRVAAYGQKLTRLSALNAAQRTARRHDRGLWGACR
jgi:micrococcal nuclease